MTEETIIVFLKILNAPVILEPKFNALVFKEESVMTRHYFGITNLSVIDRSKEHTLPTHCSTNHW